MDHTLPATPKADGFRMPGEFSAHAGCWMLWPVRPDNWREGGKPAQRTFAAVADAVSEDEPVTLCVAPEHYLAARSMVSPRVRVVEMTYDDAWMRDCGPTFVVNAAGELRAVDWRFNAWGGFQGGLYAPWQRDSLVARKVLDIERVPRYAPDMVLEGGSIEVDGQGTVITTEQCLLHPNRNPDRSRAQIERHLQDYLGIETVIWLGEGVYRDETDGHVDNLCRFVAPAEVALTWTDDTADPQHAVCRDAEARLARARDALGRSLKIHRLHQPGPLYMSEAEAAGVQLAPQSKPRRAGDRLAGSYVNFYIGNRVVVMPVFSDPHDQAAVDTLAALFPDRRIAAVPGREILLGGGNIHCITQQQPRGTPAPG